MPSELIIPVEPSVRGLIFDCDGTLADTMRCHLDAWHVVLGARGIRLDEAYLDSFRGVPTEQIVLIINEDHGLSLCPTEIADAKEELTQGTLHQAKPIVEVTSIVEHYRGQLPMAVASGGRRANVEMTLKAIGLLESFEAIVTADDPVKPKPAPDIFLEAARRIGISPEFCQVFEDGDAGIDAARNAAMIVTDIRRYVPSTAPTPSL